MISGALSFTTTMFVAALINMMLDMSRGSKYCPRTCSADDQRVLAMGAHHMGIITLAWCCVGSRIWVRHPAVPYGTVWVPYDVDV